MAARFFVNGGVNNLWGTTGNWATTSGGAGGASVPNSGDDVTFDANSPSCTIDTTNRACKSLTATNWGARTLTLTFGLTVSGNLILGASMAFAGPAGISIDANATITPNGTTVSVPLSLQGFGAIYTLTGDLTCTALLTIGGGTANVTPLVNGFTIYAGAGLTHNGYKIEGTTAVVFNGPGTWQSTQGGYFGLSTTINLVGTLTIGAALNYAVGTLTYTAGTVVTTGSLLTIGAGCTLNTGAVVWRDVSIGNAMVITLSSDFRLSGTLSAFSSGNVQTTINGAFSVYVGGLSLNLGGSMLGTATLVFNGTGTWANVSAGGSLALNTNINTAGTLTLSGSVRFGGNGATLTYTAGTLVTTGSTLIITPGNASTTQTLNTSGCTWANVAINANATTTLSSNLLLSGTLTLGSGNTSSTVINGFSILCSGSLSVFTSSGTISGTTNLVLNGTGSWSAAAGLTSGTLRLNLEVNTSGTITITGQVNYDTGLLKLTAGTILGKGSVLYVQANTTITCNGTGASWGTFLIPATITVTFNGSEGWTAEGLVTRGGNGTTLIFQSGETYILTGLFFVVGIPGSTTTLRASTASSAAYLQYRGAAQAFTLGAVTDLDSSGGKPCYAMGSTLTRTANWTNQGNLRHPLPFAPAVLPSCWKD